MFWFGSTLQLVMPFLLSWNVFKYKRWEILNIKYKIYFILVYVLFTNINTVKYTGTNHRTIHRTIWVLVQSKLKAEGP